MRWTGWIWIMLWSTACLAGPATRPAVLKVGIAPFTAIGPAKGYEWVGQAIQQSLLADLSRIDGIQAMELASPDDAGRVDWVVNGAFQVLDPDLRITAQIKDPHTGQTIGGIKAGGGIRDLFALEDEAGMQLKRLAAKAIQPQTPPADKPARQPIETPTDVRLRQYTIRPYAGSDLQQAVNGGNVVDRYLQEQEYYNRYMLGWPTYGYGYTNAPYGPYGYGVPVYGWGWSGFGFNRYPGACHYRGHGWRR